MKVRQHPWENRKNACSLVGIGSLDMKRATHSITTPQASAQVAPMKSRVFNASMLLDRLTPALLCLEIAGCGDFMLAMSMTSGYAPDALLLPLLRLRCSSCRQPLQTVRALD